MKKYLIVALVALSVITAFGFLIHQNKKLRRERDAYHNNTEVLLSEVERYQTKSGEQAVRVGELQLRVAELERYRADDAALIRDMGVKKKELEQLTKIQQQTIYKLQGKARDTVFCRGHTRQGRRGSGKVRRASRRMARFLVLHFPR